MKFHITVTRISTYVVTAKDKAEAYKIASSTHSTDKKVSCSVPEQAISIQEVTD